jgi:glycosyltransferase involved in cell wall biosynthesis
VNGKRETPDVEVIVLTKNEGPILRTCLEAVLGQSYEGRFGVTMVDSGSTDGGLEAARALPIRLIEIPPHEFHHARTRNLAAERSPAPILVYTNGHTLPVGNSWLARLTAPLREHLDGNIAGVYGRQIPRSDAYPMEQFMLSRLYGPRPRLQCALPTKPLTLEQTLFSTANCAIRRDLWARRPFSDRVRVSEDQEWSRYWLSRDYAIAYEPAAAVIHSHNHPLKHVFRRYYDSGESSQASYLPADRGAQTRFAASGVRYLAEETAFLLREGYTRWLLFAAAHEALKVAGLTLGHHHRRLPSQLKRLVNSAG